MVNNGLPNQTAKVTQPPTMAVEDNGAFNMISDITSVITKTVNSLTPAADTLLRYSLAKQTIKNQNSQNLDGSREIDPSSEGGLFSGGLSNSNNQTLLVIAGLAAAAVAVIILAK
jgi:hypothetical protein